MTKKPFYRPDDLANFDYARQLGDPGTYPFTRGLYPDMYHTKLWTMRQFAGFGTASDTNKRFHFLLQQGQTGLSTAFDLPTLMGYDSDHSRAFGEVGKNGVAVDSLADVETLFQGIQLDQITTSMTINGPAVILYAMYVACAEQQGVPSKLLRGTLQNDILKEYIAQRTWIFPPDPSLRLITDLFKFAKRHTPLFNTVSISGYHIREAGATASQELAFTLADGLAYVDAGTKAGLTVDEFAPRLSFFFNAHMDFFEEIAKYRAARRMWARYMRETYHAQDPHSWMLRFHTQTAGCSLTKQQPENNIVRTAIEALAAVLGGTQSLHTNALDETIALPSELAAHIAVRTQQVIAHETGVAQVVDPLAGSYYLEHLTNQLEEEAESYLRHIRELGGVVRALELGFFHKEIADSAERYQKEVESGQRVIVGVNKFRAQEELFQIPVHQVPLAKEREQVKRLRLLKRHRAKTPVKKTLAALKQAARGKGNLIPKILDCARAYATLGEIVDVLKDEFGEYEPPVVV